MVSLPRILYYIMAAMGSPPNIHIIRVMIVKYKCNRITRTIIR